MSASSGCTCAVGSRLVNLTKDEETSKRNNWNASPGRDTDETKVNRPENEGLAVPGSYSRGGET